jgi:hypothetical protein
MTAYDEYRKNKIESGLIYQDFIVDLMLQVLRFPVTTYSSRFYQATVGEGPAGVEIKHDEQFARTGNLWIEVAEKASPRPGDYVPSGIWRDDNSWLYIIGNYDLVFVFSKLLLQGFAATGRYPILENRFGTSRGFLLPGYVAHCSAVRVIAPKAEQKIISAVGDLHELGRHLHRVLLANRAQRTLPFEKEPA